VGKRYAWIGLISIFLFLISFCVGAAEPEVTFQELVVDGYREVMVDTPLTNYVFSERSGALKSAFLTFSPYGSSVAELVYGANHPMEDSLHREYAAEGEFPFTLVRYFENEEGEQQVELDGIYTMGEPVFDEAGVLHLEFLGEFGGYAIRKAYAIAPDTLYTIDFEIQVTPISDDLATLNLLFAKMLPSYVKRDPVYIFNGKASTAVFARGTYGSFGGLGNMDDETAFFLVPEPGQDVVPFVQPIPYPEPLDDSAPSCDGNCGRYGLELGEVGETTTYRFTLYGGRRRFVSMEAAGIEVLDETGFFARLMVYVIRLLNWFYAKTGNYGWAIMLFTILMRIVLFPLMRKQYHSMARIQQIQPRLKRIQEKYKDNKEEMQKQTLEVYRKEKVNPMSGCFPMAIQLPIIIVIWRALLYASEQIHLSPGFLWVPDLSLHDPYYILIIVTTAIMMVQQYFMSPMTSDAAGPQKYMGYVFPLVMAFFLRKFPAGLWLYYLLTTAAQVGQQAFVNWEMARASAGQVAVPEDEFIDVDEVTDIDESTTENNDGDTA